VSKSEQWDDLVWDSGKVLSANSVGVTYAGAALASRQRYLWRVRVWDEVDVSSDWSEAAVWTSGSE
jgi:alpha-L-rhamnosidase